MKKIKIWSILMLAVLVMPLIASCGSDDDNDKPINYVLLYEQKFMGSWNLVYRTTNGEAQDLTYYKQVVHFKNDLTFQKDIYDYSAKKIPITAESKITSTVTGKYYVKIDGEGLYKLCMIYDWDPEKRKTYYLFSFSNDDTRLIIKDSDSKYFVTDQTFEKINN